MNKRQLGMLDATMIIIGSMIGSGIFLAPALIAQIIVSSRMGSGKMKDALSNGADKLLEASVAGAK